MIRHVVLFKFKPGTSPEGIAEWAAGVDGMRGKIPGLLNMSHGADVLGAARSFDYAIVADFESLGAIGVYDTHPLHEPLKRFSLPNSETIHSVDFTIDTATPALV